MKLLAAPLLFFALTAWCGAQLPLDDDPSKPGRTHVSFSFDELDLNDDGAIAETESAFDAALSENFAKHDRDGDGKLSRLEFDVARAVAYAKRRRSGT
jgi:hypothetical protein